MISMSEIQVKKRSDKTAKFFLIIPLIFSLLSFICFVCGCFLELPTKRGTIYSLVMFASFIFLGLKMLPGVIFTIIGLIRAAKAKMTGFLILGILELIGFVLSVSLVLFIIFVAGAGV